jgi:hypothetical protein
MAAPATKTDYKTQLKQFYGGKVAQPVVVNLPVMKYLMIDGHGDPNTAQEYIEAVETLYSVAYTIKFMCKAELLRDFTVMPLEGLWWTPDMRDFNTKDKSNWLWTAMIMQPDIVTLELFTRAVAQVASKKPSAALNKLRFEAYDEGRAAQVLYIGPYAEEGPTIAALHHFIAQQGGRLGPSTKHHHEIYLSDPRRTDPLKLKTIIRQSFEGKS